MAQSRKPIGRILLERRAVSSEKLDSVLADDSSEGRLASRLAEQGAVSEVDAVKALSEQHGIPGIDLSQICLKLDELEILPREIAEKHLILPVLSRDSRLFVAVGNPQERKVVDELEFVTGKKVYTYVALERTLARLIDEAYTRKARGEEYYVGPRCPPDVLRRCGLGDSDANRGEEASEESAKIPPPSPSAHDTPGVLVDDTLSRASLDDDVEDSGFGDISPDLSVVAAIPDGAEQGPLRHSKTVLVVDDEADIVRMLTRLLEAQGHVVLSAGRGLLALRMVKEHVPDVIILDAILPEVHGFEIARRIKGSKLYGHIPIIMVSAVCRGWRYAEDVKHGCGVENFIEKPFKIADVLAAVDKCLSDVGERAAGADAPPQSEALCREAEQALRAGVAAYRAGRPEEAMDQLRRGLEIDPLAYRLHFHLGLLYGKLGQVYEAINELEKAVSINSRHFPAVKNLAVLYQKAGFRHKAAEMWERSLALATDEATRRSIKDHLIRLL